MKRELESNTVRLDQGKLTTQEIDEFYKSTDTILIVVDDQNTHNQSNICAHGVYEIMNEPLPKKLVLPILKFQKLVFHNFIRSEFFNLIILRVPTLKIEIKRIIRQFMHQNSQDSLYKMFIYLNEFTYDDLAFLNAKLADYNFLRSCNFDAYLRSKFSHYVIYPKQTQDLQAYLKNKSDLHHTISYKNQKKFAKKQYSESNHISYCSNKKSQYPDAQYFLNENSTNHKLQHLRRELCHSELIIHPNASSEFCFAKKYNKELKRNIESNNAFFKVDSGVNDSNISELKKIYKQCCDFENVSFKFNFPLLKPLALKDTPTYNNIFSKKIVEDVYGLESNEYTSFADNYDKFNKSIEFFEIWNVLLTSLRNVDFESLSINKRMVFDDFLSYVFNHETRTDMNFIKTKDRWPCQRVKIEKAPRILSKKVCEMYTFKTWLFPHCFLRSLHIFGLSKRLEKNCSKPKKNATKHISALINSLYELQERICVEKSSNNFQNDGNQLKLQTAKDTNYFLEMDRCFFLTVFSFCDQNSLFETIFFRLKSYSCVRTTVRKPCISKCNPSICSLNVLKSYDSDTVQKPHFKNIKDQIFNENFFSDQIPKYLSVNTNGSSLHNTGCLDLKSLKLPGNTKIAYYRSTLLNRLFVGSNTQLSGNNSEIQDIAIFLNQILNAVKDVRRQQSEIYAQLIRIYGDCLFIKDQMYERSIDAIKNQASGCFLIESKYPLVIEYLKKFSGKSHIVYNLKEYEQRKNDNFTYVLHDIIHFREVSYTQRPTTTDFDHNDLMLNLYCKVKSPEQFENFNETVVSHDTTAKMAEIFSTSDLNQHANVKDIISVESQARIANLKENYTLTKNINAAHINFDDMQTMINHNEHINKATLMKNEKNLNHFLTRSRKIFIPYNMNQIESLRRALNPFTKVYLYHTPQNTHLIPFLTYLTNRLKIPKKEENLTSYVFNHTYLEIDMGYVFLLHLNYLIQRLFKQEFIFLTTLNFDIEYKEVGASGFICTLTFPRIHKELDSFKSTLFPKKTEARCDVAIKVIAYMCANGFLDGFMCPSLFKFIYSNEIYYDIIGYRYGFFPHIIQSEERIKVNTVSNDSEGLNVPNKCIQSFSSGNNNLQTFHSDKIDNFSTFIDSKDLFQDRSKSDNDNTLPSQFSLNELNGVSSLPNGGMDRVDQLYILENTAASKISQNFTSEFWYKNMRGFLTDLEIFGSGIEKLKNQQISSQDLIADIIYDNENITNYIIHRCSENNLNIQRNLELTRELFDLILSELKNFDLNHRINGSGFMWATNIFKNFSDDGLTLAKSLYKRGTDTRDFSEKPIQRLSSDIFSLANIDMFCENLETSTLSKDSFKDSETSKRLDFNAESFTQLRSKYATNFHKTEYSDLISSTKDIPQCNGAKDDQGCLQKSIEDEKKHSFRSSCAFQMRKLLCMKRDVIFRKYEERNSYKEIQNSGVDNHHLKLTLKQIFVEHVIAEINAAKKLTFNKTFEKNHSIDLGSIFEKDVIKKKFEENERKAPECLQKPDEIYYVYGFETIISETEAGDSIDRESPSLVSKIHQYDHVESKRALDESDKINVKQYSNFTENMCMCIRNAVVKSLNLGICTSRSFEEDLIINRSRIKLLKKVRFTEQQLSNLVYFQAVVFSIFANKTSQSIKKEKNYFYLITPILNGDVDFETLKNYNPSRFLIKNVFKAITFSKNTSSFTNCHNQSRGNLECFAKSEKFPSKYDLDPAPLKREQHNNNSSTETTIKHLSVNILDTEKNPNCPYTDNKNKKATKTSINDQQKNSTDNKNESIVDFEAVDRTKKIEERVFEFNLDQKHSIITEPPTDDITPSPLQDNEVRQSDCSLEQYDQNTDSTSNYENQDSVSFKYNMLSNTDTGFKNWPLDPLLATNLLYNPFNRFYYSWFSTTDIQLEQKTVFTDLKQSYKEYFESKYDIKLKNRDKHTLFVAKIYDFNFDFSVKSCSKKCELDDITVIEKVYNDASDKQDTVDTYLIKSLKDLPYGDSLYTMKNPRFQTFKKIFPFTYQAEQNPLFKKDCFTSNYLSNSATLQSSPTSTDTDFINNPFEIFANQKFKDHEDAMRYLDNLNIDFPMHKYLCDLLNIDVQRKVIEKNKDEDKRNILQNTIGNECEKNDLNPQLDFISSYKKFEKSNLFMKNQFFEKNHNDVDYCNTDKSNFDNISIQKNSLRDSFLEKTPDIANLQLEKSPLLKSTLLKNSIYDGGNHKNVSSSFNEKSQNHKKLSSPIDTQFQKRAKAVYSILDPNSKVDSGDFDSLRINIQSDYIEIDSTPNLFKKEPPVDSVLSHIKTTDVDSPKDLNLLYPIQEYENNDVCIVLPKTSKTQDINVYNVLSKIKKVYVGNDIDANTDNQLEVGDSYRNQTNENCQDFVKALSESQKDQLIDQNHIESIDESLNVLSTEIIKISAIHKAHIQDLKYFPMFLYYFETASLAHELKEKLRVPITTQNALTCITPKFISPQNYERLEFLGDSVLKYTITKFIFLNIENMTQMSREKDLIICNDSLFQKAIEMKIPSYFTFSTFSKKNFKPPNIHMLSKTLKYDFESLFEYYRCKNTFLYQPLKLQTNNIKDNDIDYYIKTYSDIIESLIGATYIENGFLVGEKFIHTSGISLEPNFSIQNIEYIRTNIAKKLLNETHETSKLSDTGKQIHMDSEKKQIFERPFQEKIQSESGSDFKENLMNEDNLIYPQADKLQVQIFQEWIDSTYIQFCEKKLVSTIRSTKSMYIKYERILDNEAASEIQKILRYDFKDLGILEKAVIHPSSNNNPFGSSFFNKLELLGDSVLDLAVSHKLFLNEEYKSPLHLHSARKSLVNNFSLARILFKLNLHKFVHVGFDEVHIKKMEIKLKKDGESVNKVFADIIEAILGAILLDMDCDFDSSQRYIYSNFWEYLLECSDHTR